MTFPETADHLPSCHAIFAKEIVIFGPLNPQKVAKKTFG